MKKIVIVSGLHGDFLRRKFGEMLDLIPDCDEVIKLDALCILCNDGTPASFTWKIIDNTINSGDIIDIGGADKYIPLCRKHYNEEISKQSCVDK
jgi:thymidine kinase